MTAATDVIKVHAVYEEPFWREEGRFRVAWGPDALARHGGRPSGPIHGKTTPG